MKLISWNIEQGGIRGLGPIAERIAQEHADFACLQEVIDPWSLARNKELKRDFRDFKRDCGFPRMHLDLEFRQARKTAPKRTQSNTNATLMMVKPCAKGVVALSATQEVVWTLFAEFTLGNVHLDTRPEENLDETKRLLKGCSVFPTIIAGDFNFYKGSPSYNAMIDAGFVDWTSGFNRRDKVFARGDLTPVIVGLDKTVDGTLSDHPMVIVDFECRKK